MLKISSISILTLIVVAFALAAPRTRFVRRLPTRIVGGENAIRNEFPYLISLQYFGSPICSGAIITANAIITAAHCAEVGPPEAFTIKAGKHNLSEVEETEQIRRVASYVIHEGYPGIYGFSNDIAVLRPETPLDLNTAVSSVRLPPAGHTAAGVGVIAGWGSTQEGGPASDIIQKTQIPVLTDAECLSVYGVRFEENMLCAGLPQGGKDFCEGDSGTALVTNDLGHKYLAGIASWGLGCGRPVSPGVYTEISYHTEFINTNSA